MIGWHIAQQRWRHIESAGRRIGDDPALCDDRNAIARGIGRKPRRAPIASRESAVRSRVRERGPASQRAKRSPSRASTSS
jgi:hypothetical protein